MIRNFFLICSTFLILGLILVTPKIFSSSAVGAVEDMGTGDSSATDTPADDVKELPPDPGLEDSPFSVEDNQPVLDKDSSILNIIRKGFSSYATAITTFVSCQNGEVAEGTCVSVPDWSDYAKQYQYTYGQGDGAEGKGGPLLPKFVLDKLQWPVGESDEQRYQYAGCYKADNPNSILHLIVAKAVNSFMAITVKNQPDLNFVAGGLTFDSALTGTTEPLNKYKFTAPNKYSNLYEGTTVKPVVKKEYEAILSDCDKESTGQTVTSREEPVSGDISGGTPVNVQASPLETFQEAVRVIGDCTANLGIFQKCLAFTVGYTFKAHIKVVAPLLYNAVTATGPVPESDLPPTVRSEKKPYFTSGVRTNGSMGAVLPIAFTKDAPGYADSHGTVDSMPQVAMDTGDGNGKTLAGSLVYTLAHKFGNVMRWGKKCNVLPYSMLSNYKLTDDECMPEPPPASNWANNQPVLKPGKPAWCGKTTTLGSCGSNCMDPIYPVSPRAKLNNPYMDGFITQAAQQVNIPKCVLEAVAMIEGGMHWTKDDWSPGQECVPNMWSAAGPFQITTDHDTCGGSCASGAGYCPNTWGNKPGSPCDPPIAAVRSAEILRDKSNAAYGGGCPNGGVSLGKLSTQNWKEQRDRVAKSACHYYGGPAHHARLGGLSYHEFVLAHCQYVDP